MPITLDAAKAIYRQAIDAQASDVEGPAWWDEVAEEMRNVINVRTLTDAAELITWWHHDWTGISDTPRAAAKRIRDAARGVRLNA